MSVGKTRTELEDLCRRYGATGFVTGWLGERASVGFEMGGRQVRVELRLPHPSDAKFTRDGNGKTRKPDVAGRAWEQACRQSWRVLLLLVRAKLEAIESGVATFEEEFLANLVIPGGGGTTVGERVLGELGAYLDSGKLPPLLPGMRK